MRFASVYKDFQDPADFERELEDLGSLRKTHPKPAPPPRDPATAGRGRAQGGRYRGRAGPKGVGRGGTHDSKPVELATRT